ncbi:MAG: DUF1460 domain-containing protein [Deltaproteobacteria bacterium]|nr:DUF1460 domain-containing protein [Deltaproteobacteria bacterium]
MTAPAPRPRAGRRRRAPWLVTALVLALLPVSSAAADSDRRQVAVQLKAIHRRAATHAQRLNAVSALFVGRPFAASPLGEGPAGRVDADPIARFDRFDCVTYVEQVMALSWHESLDVAIAELQRVRYTDGTIRYGARKHIMMAQWIPENVAAGFVRDITAAVAGPSASVAELTLDHGAFVAAAGQALRLARADRPLGVHRLPILPVAALSSRIEQVPHGTIITSIRAARPGVPYRASHVGLVIVDPDGKRVVRHAHRRRGRVIEQPLQAFAQAARRGRRWPIVGFHLLAIAERPPAPVLKPTDERSAGP